MGHYRFLTCRVGKPFRKAKQLFIWRQPSSYSPPWEPQIQLFIWQKYKIKVIGNIFTNQSKQISVITRTCHTQLLLSDSMHKQSVPTSDIVHIGSVFQHRGLQKTIPHNINIRHLPRPHFLCPIFFRPRRNSWLAWWLRNWLFSCPFPSLYHGFGAKFCSGRGFCFWFFPFVS
jgi:hypothetical protein